MNDGRQMLSGHKGDNPPIILWDVSSGEVLRTYRGHTGDVLSLRILPDGRHFISGSADGTLRIWSLDHDRELYRGEDPTALTEMSPLRRTANSLSLEDARPMLRKERGPTDLGASRLDRRREGRRPRTIFHTV